MLLQTAGSPTSSHPTRDLADALDSAYPRWSICTPITADHPGPLSPYPSFTSMVICTPITDDHPGSLRLPPAATLASPFVPWEVPVPPLHHSHALLDFQKRIIAFLEYQKRIYHPALHTILSEQSAWTMCNPACNLLKPLRATRCHPMCTA